MVNNSIDAVRFMKTKKFILLESTALPVCLMDDRCDQSLYGSVQKIWYGNLLFCSMELFNILGDETSDSIGRESACSHPDTVYGTTHQI